MNIAFSVQCYKKLRAKGYKPAAALYAAKFYKSRYSIVKDLRRMPSVEQIKRQQALDIISAFEPKGEGK